MLSRIDVAFRFRSTSFLWSAVLISLIQNKVLVVDGAQFLDSKSSSADSARLVGTTHLGFETVVHNSTYGPEAPTIIFTHLLKGGGTSIDKMLGSYMGRVWQDNPAYGQLPLYIRQDTLYGVDSRTLSTSFNTIRQQITSPASTGYTAYAGSNFFRIGNVRNPCDYLLSMWAFQSTPNGASTGHGKVPHQCLAESLQGTGVDAAELYGKDIHEHLSTPDDINRFRKWVKGSAGKQLHYLSYRSYLAAQVDPFGQSIPWWDDGQYFACLGKLSPSEEQRIVNELESIDLAQRYDCIIHTKTLQDDMRTCMLKFEDRIADVRVRDRLVQKMREQADTAVSANPSKHGSCEQYFDADTADFVWAREGAFASKLGYSQCCAKPQPS